MKNEKLTRDQYVEQKKKQLDSWNKEIDVLEANALKLKKEVKDAYDRKILEARAKYKEGAKNLSAMKESAANSWEHLKGVTENVFKAFRDSIDEFRSHF